MQYKLEQHKQFNFKNKNQREISHDSSLNKNKDKSDEIIDFDIIKNDNLRLNQTINDFDKYNKHIHETPVKVGREYTTESDIRN